MKKVTIKHACGHHSEAEHNPKLGAKPLTLKSKCKSCETPLQAVTPEVSRTPFTLVEKILLGALVALLGISGGLYVWNLFQ